MKKILPILGFAALSLTATAQVADGFYRVQNIGSSRYAYVYDNTGSVNVATTSAEMGAIALFYTPEKRFSDPASVIYIRNHGSGMYNLETQGTSVHDIIDYYVKVTEGTSGYYVYEPTYSMYLWDEETSTFFDQSYIGTTAVKKNGKTQENYRNWKVIPVNASTDEYLGIAPNENIKVGDKYYKAYYLGFPFTLSSGMKAYYVSDVKSDAVVIKEITGTVPAKTPVIIECSSADCANNRINILTSGGNAINDNKLKGNFFCYEDHQKSAASHVGYEPTTMRVLAVKDGKLQYITDTNHEYTTEMDIQSMYSSYTYFLNANESYLPVAAGSPANLPVMTEAEYNATHGGKKGDLNNDGVVNAGDVIALYNLIKAGATATAHPEADLNADGTISAGDIISLYNLIKAGA